MTACESQDRLYSTRFTPLSDTEFVYDVQIILIYSDEDRERWLKDELAINGMCPNGFEIVERRRVQMARTWLGDPEREITRGKCKEG
ncbi:MAG: hypothetical protein VX620_15310 [Pseudomonadota bacterium]|nr:hypothetical protein [Pseudomonadota bacterium]